ncbi:MAG: hypothetical protein JWR80_8516 [Bradyrhizobium sp.]|nr:hypothetical protein [Bradyrhizobium sp.]
MLQNFVKENYWLIMNGILFEQFDGSYAERVPAEAKKKFAKALASSEIFRPHDDLTLFPIIPVRVESDFDSGPFFLIRPTSLTENRLPVGIDLNLLEPSSFPPLSNFGGPKESPGAWLGIRSPVFQASNKMKAAILGAMALTPSPNNRHMFSMRRVFGGRCTITSGGASTGSGEAHTPPMMHDIIIGERDAEWLGILAVKLTANERPVRRQLKALEYYYRAWSLDPSERFPILCMALDAIFGHANHATQAVVDGVREVLGSHVREARVRLLMDLRASVIHGGAPDVYDSRKYGRYYDDYEADPIHDLELVVAKCLQIQIFGDAFKEHPDPNAAIIAQAQASGGLPRKLSRNTILEDVP